MKLRITVAIFCCLAGISMFCLNAAEKVESNSSAAFKAYGDMNYSRARKISNAIIGAKVSAESDKQSARLLLSLSDVFDNRKQDLQSGFAGLKKIYEDKSVAGTLRVQAKLAYARAAQCMQMRKGLFEEADGIDFNSLYDEVIRENSATPEACFAAAYQAEGCFRNLEVYFLDGNDVGASGKTSGLSEADAKRLSAAFLQLERFIKGYKGDRIYLASLYQMLADRYVIHHRDYLSYVKYLKAALECGITNPKGREVSALRVARAYDAKLHDRANAEKYYLSFLQQYPNSAFVPIVKRYLSELKN